MAIMKTGSTVSLPLDLGLPQTSPLLASEGVVGGFNQLLQGSLQARSAAASVAPDGNSLPPAGEPLPDEVSDGLVATEDSASMPSVSAEQETDEQVRPPVEPEGEVQVSGTEVDANPAVVPAPASTAPVAASAVPGQQPAATAEQAEAWIRTEVKESTPGRQVSMPTEEDGKRPFGVRPLTPGAVSNQAAVDVNQPATPVVLAANATGGAVTASPSPQVAPTPPVVPVQSPLAPVQTEGAVAQVSRVEIAAIPQTAGVMGGAESDGPVAAVTPRAVSAAQIEPETSVSLEVTRGQVLAAEGGGTTGANAAVATRAVSDVGMSAGEEVVNPSRQQSVLAATLPVAEGGDQVGKEAAVVLTPGSRIENTRPVGELLATRQDIAAQSAQMNVAAGSEGGDAGTSGQSSRQDGQAAATASLMRAGDTAPASSTRPESTFEQRLQQQLAEPRWGRQIGERAIMMAQHGPKVAHIQLDPPELGAMQIRVHLQGQDQVSVSFTSASPAVRDALEQQLPRLREMFADQGLNLQDSSVSDDARRQHSDQREQAEASGQQAGGYGGQEGDELEVQPLHMLAAGLVDYYA
ncbi:flagellar hook-length control protein FliK [Marinobacterium marinum]|uniref:Flagellar hook-length control protein FliK n=1 Tax=Marinobacterium marinum TaxID=2756129 RepID=A0A7W2AB30_9GAMM|nr:flagellar hook-length control protein FliK [Marinobacterium marinum]MBA4501057.1 flagellar hook-length control protein FliK [Marinobacterium marinum]